MTESKSQNESWLEEFNAEHRKHGARLIADRAIPVADLTATPTSTKPYHDDPKLDDGSSSWIPTGGNPQQETLEPLATGNPDTAETPWPL